MTAAITIGGHFDAGWEPVVSAFASTVDPLTGGAALAIHQDDREVVDVFAGTADIRTGRPWTSSTQAVLFSSTKGLAALTVAWLADHGQIDVDAPVASVWPEFGMHGKDDITIGDVLAQRAGLPAPDAPLGLEELLDNRVFAARLASQAPLWHRAASHLYHPLTWGPLVSEIVRRATGEEISAVFHREIAAPADAQVTLQPTLRETADVAYVTNSPELELISTQTIPLLGGLAVAGYTAGGALPLALVGDGTGLNDPRVLASGLVSAGGVGTATGLARVWGSTVGDQPLLSDSALVALVHPRSEGRSFQDTSDGTGGRRWGAGVQLASTALPLLTPRSFGHDGAGGQCGFADPDYNIGFGYVRNRLSHSPLAPEIIAAVRGVVS